MKWLLFFVIFEIDPSGNMQQHMTGTKVFATEAACDRAGNKFREGVPSIPKHWKSISACIPQSAYNS